MQHAAVEDTCYIFGGYFVSQIEWDVDHEINMVEIGFIGSLSEKCFVLTGAWHKTQGILPVRPGGEPGPTPGPQPAAAALLGPSTWTLKV